MWSCNANQDASLRDRFRQVTNNMLLTSVDQINEGPARTPSLLTTDFGTVGEQADVRVQGLSLCTQMTDGIL